MTASSSPDDLGVVVLAAGLGTRLRSSRPKVLHEAAGRPLLRWVLEALRPLGAGTVAVVVGHEADAVQAEADACGIAGLVCVDQGEPRGTGHAVRVALDAPALDGVRRIVVLPGDAPALTTALLAALVDAQAGQAAALVGALLEEPTGYGRLLRGVDGRLERIVEEADATPQERLVREVNAGMYCFDRDRLERELAHLRPDNVQGEEYLTDVVAPLVPEGIAVVAADAATTAGVNDRAQLADVAAVLRRRVLVGLMRTGVTVVDPVTTYVGPDVVVEPDAVLLPGTHLEGATRVGAGAVVGPDARLVDADVGRGATVTYSVVLRAVVGDGATVGPFAYLRPAARLEAGAKVGTFVEVKGSTVGEGSKVPHLSYIGDAEIGEGVNVGAGTITCNYDGFAKHRTEIGDGAFIGSDTMLVAPVRIGAGAVTGAGSVVTSDVPDDALAVERADQRTVEGWAARRRARHDATDARAT